MEENQVQQQNEVNVDTQPSVHEEPKMVQMTQEQLDELISKRLSRQEKKLNEQFEKRLNEMSEAQKLQAMSEQEKAHYQAQKERETFEEERKAFYAERDAFNKQLYKAEIQRQLNEANLPDISDTLVGLEAEVVKAQINTMKQSFDAQINRTVEAKIKQSASIPTVPQKEQQLLTIEQIKALSVDEYNANRDLVQKSLQAMKK